LSPRLAGGQLTQDGIVTFAMQLQISAKVDALKMHAECEASTSEH